MLFVDLRRGGAGQPNIVQAGEWHASWRMCKQAGRRLAERAGTDRQAGDPAIIQLFPFIQPPPPAHTSRCTMLHSLCRYCSARATSSPVRSTQSYTCTADKSQGHRKRRHLAVQQPCTSLRDHQALPAGQLAEMREPIITHTRRHDVSPGWVCLSESHGSGQQRWPGAGCPAGSAP